MLGFLEENNEEIWDLFRGGGCGKLLHTIHPSRDIGGIYQLKPIDHPTINQLTNRRNAAGKAPRAQWSMLWTFRS